MAALPQNRPVEGWTRMAPLGVVALGAGALAIAFTAQWGFGLQPCDLCLWQRWPYVAAIAFGIIALATRTRRGMVVMLQLAGLAFLVTAGIGVFHAGVEWHWWAGLPSCSAQPAATSLEALRNQLLAAPIVRCDEPAFVFLGLSMAGWNVLYAVVAALFSFGAARDARNC
jgi:disulfide bond formation protein DsbB